MNRALVSKVAVTRFAMVSEALSMIRQQHDERPLPPPGLRQRLRKASEDLIDVTDLCVISHWFRESRAGDGVQSVRSMQVEEMNENEYRFAFMRGEPLGCSAQD